MDTARVQEILEVFARCNQVDPQEIVRSYRPHIRALHMGDASGIHDLSPLAGFSELLQLFLPEIGTGDFSPIAQLTGLQRVRLSGPNVVDLSPLAGLCHLQDLFLYNSPNLSDLSPLRGLVHLKTVECHDTAVADLSPLAGKTELLSLNACNTRVSDIRSLTGLPSLKGLFLTSTKVADISPVAEMPGLEHLYLWDTPVTDFSAIDGLAHFKGLSVEKARRPKPKPIIGSIKTRMEELCKLLEKQGAALFPPLEEDAVRSYEKQHGVALPEAYRAFLLQFGDGWPGGDAPGCFPLAKCRLAEDVRRDFPLAEEWIWESGGERPEVADGYKRYDEEDLISAVFSCGHLQLMDLGCGRGYYLILNGPAKGQVWDIADVGAAPCLLDFLRWAEAFWKGNLEI